MSLTLHAGPFSSCCQKVLIAPGENATPFTYRHLEEPGAAEERAAFWALGRFPVLVDGGRVVAESGDTRRSPSPCFPRMSAGRPGSIFVRPASGSENKLDHMVPHRSSVGGGESPTDRSDGKIPGI